MSTPYPNHLGVQVLVKPQRYDMPLNCAFAVRTASDESRWFARSISSGPSDVPRHPSSSHMVRVLSGSCLVRQPSRGIPAMRCKPHRGGSSDFVSPSGMTFALSSVQIKSGALRRWLPVCRIGTELATREGVVGSIALSFCLATGSCE